MSQEKFMFKCDVCGSSYQHGPHRYEGHRLKLYGVILPAIHVGKEITMAGHHITRKYCSLISNGRAFRSRHGMTRGFSLVISFFLRPWH